MGNKIADLNCARSIASRWGHHSNFADLAANDFNPLPYRCAVQPGSIKGGCGYVHARCDLAVSPTGVHRPGVETVEPVPGCWKAPDAWNSSPKSPVQIDLAPATITVTRSRSPFRETPWPEATTCDERSDPERELSTRVRGWAAAQRRRGPRVGGAAARRARALPGVALRR